MFGCLDLLCVRNTFCSKIELKIETPTNNNNNNGKGILLPKKTRMRAKEKKKLKNNETFSIFFYLLWLVGKICFLFISFSLQCHLDGHSRFSSHPRWHSALFMHFSHLHHTVIQDISFCICNNPKSYMFSIHFVRPQDNFTRNISSIFKFCTG